MITMHPRSWPYRTVFLLAAISIVAHTSSAQLETIKSDKEFYDREAQRYGEVARLQANAGAPRGSIDVAYYKLELKIIGAPALLTGSVTTIATVVSTSIADVTLDFSTQMIVDSVFVDGTKDTTWRQQIPSSLVITTPRTYTKNEKITVTVVYHGNPPSTGFGSFQSTMLSDGYTNWYATLSEPYGASDWWPCINHPNDKADSVDIWLTCNPNYKAVSQGKLVETVINGDGTKTFKWKHRYPISSYLISATITNFNTFSDWFRYSPTDSMEVVNYVTPDLPGKNSQYRNNAARTPRMLEIFSNLFGMYPFVKEKYGHAEFTWGGGMEHQTLTSLGASAFNEGTIAHELAHQWFGDMITCQTWPDLWLNEGFATYGEGLYREAQYGPAAYKQYMSGVLMNALSAKGTLVLADTTNTGNSMFAYSRVYAKGASVLHMLRHVLGDSVFFAALKAYATNPQYMYKTASTADFQLVCEQVSGLELGYFFNEWVLSGERYPKYICTATVTPQGLTSNVSVNIQQLTNTSPKFFTMPVDLRFAGKGIDTTITVINNSANQNYSFQFSNKPDTVELDPGNWIVKTVQSMITDVSGQDQASTFVLHQNYPNPFNPKTLISYQLSTPGFVSLRVLDLLGREVATLVNADQSPGYYEVEWHPLSSSSGVYFYQLRKGNFAETKRMLMLK